jgi:hypothetical protein
MRRTLTELAVLAATLAAATAAVRPAAAATEWPSEYTRIMRLTPTINGTPTPLFHIVAGDNRVYSKPASGPWTKVGAPSSTTLYGYLFGLTAVQPGGTCEARAFAVGLDAQVWELRYCSGVPTWKAWGHGFGATLVNNPPITAGYQSATSDIYVATVDNSTGHLWILTISVASDTGIWTDASASGPALNTTGSVDVNVDPGGNGSTDVWGADSAGNLQRYQINGSGWTNMGAPPNATVMPTGFASHRVSSTEYNVFATGSDYDLKVRRWNGFSWSWTDLGRPTNDFASLGRNNLAYPTPGGQQLVYLTGGSSGTLWTCVYSAGACSWAKAGTPPDSPRGLGWGYFADSLYRVYVMAGMGPYVTMAYVDSFDWAATAQWKSHLAPTDSFVTTLDTPNPTAEWDFAEYYGNLLLAGMELQTSGYYKVALYRSSDDGSSWSGPSYPFSAIASGDPNVSFDANGIAYATRMESPSPPTIKLVTSSNAGGTWSSEFAVPLPSSQQFDTIDRPYMTADWSSAGRIYLTYSDSATGNPYFMYCASGTNCATASGTWCGPYAMPSCGLINCSAQISLGGDGSLYFAGPDVSACNAQGDYDLPIAIRRIQNVKSLPSTCAAPTWTAPECLAVVQPLQSWPASAERNAGAETHGYLSGGFSIYGGAISAARDTTATGGGGALLTTLSYTDPDAYVSGSNANACTSASSHCRGNIFAAWRDPSANTWSGTTPPNMVRVHQDSGSAWVDHIMGVPLALDYKQYMVGWMDWREDPANDLHYHDYSAVVTTQSTVTEKQWPNPATWQNELGDINTGVAARLHGHFVLDLNCPNGPTLCNVPGLATVSPYAH